VKVDWPPQITGLGSPNRFSHAGKTKVEKSFYEPLDPDGFLLATKG
jgi:hypothetical protein